MKYGTMIPTSSANPRIAKFLVLFNEISVKLDRITPEIIGNKQNIWKVLNIDIIGKC
jgi:hypothetical protein